jgi:hypothetical protein
MSTPSKLPSAGRQTVAYTRSQPAPFATLETLLDAESAPAVRLGAARTITDIGLHQHDAETILQKLNEIEAYQRRG